MKTLILFSALYLIAAGSFAQAPKIQWQKTLGVIGNVNNYAKSIEPTADGGYIMAGYGQYLDNSKSDYIVAKFSSNGNIEWQKTYGGSNEDEATSIRPTADGGYIVAGSSASNDGDVSGNHGAGDVWILKLDSAGIIEWQKNYGGSKIDNAYSIAITPDGGYIVAGSSNSIDGDVTGGDGSGLAWVLRLNDKGVIQWQNIYGAGLSNVAYDIKLSIDNGFIIVGREEINSVNTADVWVAKIDSSGTFLWEKKFGGKKADEARSVQITSDGGYILLGNTNSIDKAFKDNHGGPDYMILKLDSLGNQQWQRLLGGSQGDQAYSIITTTDGGYVLAGFTSSNNGDVSINHGYIDFWIVKVDSIGNIKWQRTYGGTADDELYSLQSTADGGYIVAGLTTSTDGDVKGPRYGKADMWIVKLGPDVMPVTFSSFTAQKQKISVFLQWQTATEQNSKIFNIQRSTNGEQFTTIGSVIAAGNSTTQLSYRYTDAGAYNTAAPILYYRIEEADADGGKTYTGVAKVNYDNNSLLFTLLPNPVHNTIRLTANQNVVAATIKLVDITGKTVYSATRHIYASAITEIPASSLAPGLYMLTIAGDGIKTSLKVVKE